MSRRILTPKGTRFGELVTTGARTGRFVEVKCKHGNKNFVRLGCLRKGTSSSCRKWVVCWPKKGKRFGELIATGKFERRGPRLFAEVKCKHGNKKFVDLSHLRGGSSVGCN